MKEQYGVFQRFESRMRKLNIKITYISNYPWIYMRQINGKPVKEKFLAEHGFTAFWHPVSDMDKGIEFSDRREVFKLIRKYL